MLICPQSLWLPPPPGTASHSIHFLCTPPPDLHTSPHIIISCSYVILAKESTGAILELIQIRNKKSYNCIHIKYMQKHNFSYMQLNNPTNTLRSFLTLETAKQSLHNVHPVAVELSIIPHDLQRGDQVSVLQVTSKSQVFALKFQVKTTKSQVKSQVIHFVFRVL